MLQNKLLKDEYILKKIVGGNSFTDRVKSAAIKTFNLAKNNIVATIFIVATCFLSITAICVKVSANRQLDDQSEFIDRQLNPLGLTLTVHNEVVLGNCVKSVQISRPETYFGPPAVNITNN